MKKVRQLGKVTRELVGEERIVRPCSPDKRGEVGCEIPDAHEHIELRQFWRGVDPVRWLRFKPNPGFKRKNGKHWCRKYGRHGLP